MDNRFGRSILLSAYFLLNLEDKLTALENGYTLHFTAAKHIAGCRTKHTKHAAYRTNRYLYIAADQCIFIYCQPGGLGLRYYIHGRPVW
jgi:hypothetical protein